MKTGVALFAQNYTDWERHDRGDWAADPKVADSTIFQEEIAIGDLVEPLGFDSMWTVEHHFTPYTMDTNTLQFLTFFAGRTQRIDFGTMVVVLPWHDPIRVAEEASMLAHFLQGRKLTLGFGRGAAKVEFDGLRIDMNSSRERFLEALEVVRKALSSKRFSHEGKYFQIPDLSLRPQPPSDLLRDMHMAWGSPSSVAVAADNGLKPLVIPQKEWSTHVEEMREYNRIMLSKGFDPGQPTVLLAVYVDDDPGQAQELGHRYVVEYADSARRHYRLDDPAHLAGVTGYDHYSETARKFAEAHPDKLDRRARMLELAKTVDLKGLPTEELSAVFVNSHVWGTPDQVTEQLKERLRGVGAQQFVAVFKFGSMSRREAESSIRLFARTVLPEIQAMPIPGPVVPEPAASPSAVSS
jgi:alkanesulfonate monooxygenase SsuD/methylene tetrahydromethanopterin reductase-like flavin-dependent oxidoreductase (luciferase family)